MQYNIANQSQSNPKVLWSFTRESLKTRIGVAPLLFNPDDPGTLKYSDEEKADRVNFVLCLRVNQRVRFLKSGHVLGMVGETRNHT